MAEEMDWSQKYKDYDSTNYQLFNRIIKHATRRKKVYSAFQSLLLEQSTPKKKFLEVACGMGIEVNLLSSFGLEATGIDLENEALQYSERVKKLINSTALFKQGDAFDLSIENGTFDAVYSQGFLEHWNDTDIVALIKEQFRVIKPGGYIIMDVPAKFCMYNVYKKVYSLFNKEWIFNFERGLSKRQLISFCEQSGVPFSHTTTIGWSNLGYPFKNKFSLLVVLGMLCIRNTMRLFGVGHDAVCVIVQKK